MKNDFGQFSKESLALFAEEYSFRTCQRSDGSTYGTNGECQTGKEVKANDLDAKAKKAEEDYKKHKASLGEKPTSAELQKSRSLRGKMNKAKEKARNAKRDVSAEKREKEKSKRKKKTWGNFLSQ